MNQYFLNTIEGAFLVGRVKLKISNSTACHGGDINSCYICSTDNKTFPKIFVKLSTSPFGGQILRREHEGLQLLRNAKSSGLIPKALFLTQTSNKATTFLVLEYIDMQDEPSEPSGWNDMGKALAQIHKSTITKQFGFHHDNFIGHTIQKNTPSTTDWVKFFKKNRLAYMFELCEAAGHRFPSAPIVLNAFEAIFRVSDYKPVPCLIHGDLWSGNVSFLKNKPVFFDCATSYSDREAELAMTQFGGFPSEFYRGYNREYPIHRDYLYRFPFYLLYHCLNHVKMFGSQWTNVAEFYIGLCLKNAKAYLQMKSSENLSKSVLKARLVPPEDRTTGPNPKPTPIPEPFAEQDTSTTSSTSQTPDEPITTSSAIQEIPFSQELSHSNATVEGVSLAADE